MITIHAAMLVILGFLLAALLVLALIGPYRRRIRRTGSAARSANSCAARA